VADVREDRSTMPEVQAADEASVGTVAPSEGVRFTAAAIEMLLALLAGELGKHFRLEVAPGGCSGFKYQFFIDDRRFDGDYVAWYSKSKMDGSASEEGAGQDVFEARIGRMSWPYLAGAEIDYKPLGGGFVIDNTNAQGSCACGDSFH
jgi:Fe-S cluster assembly iron-binding protein IscA